MLGKNKSIFPVLLSSVSLVTGGFLIFVLLSHAQETPPSAPFLDSVTSPAPNDYTFTYTNVANEDGYRFYDSNNVQYGTAPINSTSRTVGGFGTNRRNTVFVRAYSAIGESANSNSRTVYTLNTSAGSASVSSVTASSFTVSAGGGSPPVAPNPAPGNQYDNYIKFRLVRVSDGVQVGDSGWIASSSYQSTGLSCGTSYNVYIQARNGGGVTNSETGPYGSFSTSACPLPDFTITKMGTWPTSVCANTQQGFGYRINNVGSGTAGYITSRLYINNTSVQDEFYSNTIAAGGNTGNPGSSCTSNDQYLCWTPSSAGTYTADVKADTGAQTTRDCNSGTGGGVTESNETNNCSSYPPATLQSITVNTAPGAPDIITFSNTTTSGTRVSWSAGSGATAYYLYRCSGSGCSRPGSPTASSVTSPYNDTSLVCGTPYSYWIESRNSCGSGVFSDPGNVTTSACPLPDLLVYSPSLAGNLCVGSTHTLTATVENAGTGATNGSPVQVQYNNVGGTSCTGASTTVINPGGLYSNYAGYCIPTTAGSFSPTATVSGGGDSSSYTSGPTSVTFIGSPGTPGTPTYSGVTRSNITVSWSSATNAANYNLYRCEGGGCGPTLYASNVTSGYVDYGVQCGRSYTYQVQATNSCGSTMGASSSVNSQTCVCGTSPNPSCSAPTAWSACSVPANQCTGTQTRTTYTCLNPNTNSALCQSNTESQSCNASSGTSCNADSNGCTQNDSCNGSGTCVAGSAPNCSDGNDCTNDSCTSTGSTTYSCTRTNLADGSTCSGTPGRCCTGACDSDGSTYGSGYAAECRSGPICLSSSNWGYVTANNGSACGSASNYCANTLTCDTRQRKNTCSSGSCTGAATDVGDTAGTSCAGQTCAPYSDTCLANPGRLRDYAGTNGTCASSSETCTAPSYTDSCVVGQCSATCNSSSSYSWSGTTCQYSCNTGSTCTYASSCTTRCSAGSSYCVSGGRCYTSVGCLSSGCTETDQGTQPANNYSSGGTCFWGCSVSCTSSGWSRTGCASGTIDDGLSCTTDTCTSTGVSHTYLAGYPKCTANNQCDDSNSNTRDLCQTPGVCSGSCQNNPCTADGWYNTGSAYCVNNGDANQCQYARKQVQDQEYRDYSSVNGAACTSTVTSTRTVDTGSSCTPVNKPNGTVCDDGLYCNLGESCTNGVCGGGSARTCPAGSCQTASCNESTDQCTTSPFTACVNSDGQCCGSCTSANDNDCANNPPDVPAIPNGPSSGVPGTPYSYNTSGSDPDGNTPLTFRFDWGDGNISGYGSATQSHSWGATGTYSVRARSRDSLLMESVAWSGTMTVTISPPADTTNPTVSSAQARPDSYTGTGEWDNDTAIFFTFTASDNVGVSSCNAEIKSGGFDSTFIPDEQVLNLASRQDTDTGVEGLNTYYVQCSDAAGNNSTPVQSDTISIDTNAPSLASPAYLTVEGTTCSGAACPATAPTITAGDPDISWNTSDTGSGLQQVEVWRGTGACPTTTWGPENPVFTTTAALSAGSWTDTGRGNGDYCYGLHVKDNVNNCRNEDGTLCGGSGSVQTARGPITVTISRSTPDFSVSFSVPTSMSVTQGTSATFNIAVAPSGGFTSSVGSWTVANCPSGAICSVAPASCVSASYASCGTLTITTGSVTPGGPYSNITVTGTGGSLTRTSTNSVSVTVNSNDTTAPTVSFVPANRSWASNDASSTVTASDSSGISFTRHCWTTSASCDPGTTAANTFTNGASITQSSGGSWNLCVRARDNSANQNWNATPICSGTYQIDKTYPSIDSLSVYESTNPGNSVSYPSSLTITAGDPVIDWTASDTGGSSLQQTEVWRANKSCATALPADWNQVTIDSSTPASGPYTNAGLGNGTYCFGVHVKDVAQNCLTEDAKDCTTSAVIAGRTVRGPITVTISRATPDFSVSFSAPTSMSVTQGTSATFNIAVAPSGGFTSSVGSWTVANCPSGAGCSVSPASCTSASYAACGTLTITTGSVTPGGPYSNITVTGTGGSLTRTSTNSVSVTVTTGANQPPNKPILIPPQ